MNKKPIDSTKILSRPGKSNLNQSILVDLFMAGHPIIITREMDDDTLKRRIEKLKKK